MNEDSFHFLAALTVTAALSALEGFTVFPQRASVLAEGMQHH